MKRLMNLVAGLFGGLVLAAAAGGEPEGSDMRPGEVFRDCTECPEMVVLPAGRFRMGSEESEDRRESWPVRDVEVAAFALGRTEVTRGEYAAFVRATGRPTYSGCIGAEPDARRVDIHRVPNVGSWRDPGFEQDEDHPVTCVSWADANAYVAWLSGITGRKYRLPSEAEWEYAARAGTETRYYWGDDWKECGYANMMDRSWRDSVISTWPLGSCDDKARYTAPVGSFASNGFGLYDMVGNVREWTADCWHGNYVDALPNGDPWTGSGDCGRPVMRGHAWD